jgi:hypothetical protein
MGRICFCRSSLSSPLEVVLGSVSRSHGASAQTLSRFLGWHCCQAEQHKPKGTAEVATSRKTCSCFEYATAMEIVPPAPASVQPPITRPSAFDCDAAQVADDNLDMMQELVDELLSEINELKHAMAKPSRRLRKDFNDLGPKSRKERQEEVKKAIKHLAAEYRIDCTSFTFVNSAGVDEVVHINGRGPPPLPRLQPSVLTQRRLDHANQIAATLEFMDRKHCSQVMMAEVLKVLA